MQKDRDRGQENSTAQEDQHLAQAAIKIEKYFAEALEKADLGMEECLVPQELHEKIQQIIANEASHKRKNPAGRRKAWRLCAACLLVFLLTVTCVVSTVDAAKLKFLRFFKESTDEYVQLTPQSEEDGVASGGDPAGFTYVMAYVPGEYELIESPSEDSVMKNTTYQSRNDAEKYLYFTQLPADGSTIAIDNEHGGSGEISINGANGFWVQTRETIVLTWLQDDFMFSLNGEIPLEEAVKMAESVSCKK